MFVCHGVPGPSNLSHNHLLSLYLYLYLRYIYFILNVKSIFFLIYGKRSRSSNLEYPVLNLTPSHFCRRCAACGYPAFVVCRSTSGRLALPFCSFSKLLSDSIRWEPIPPEPLTWTACLSLHNSAWKWDYRIFSSSKNVSPMDDCRLMHALWCIFSLRAGMYICFVGNSKRWFF